MQKKTKTDIVQKALLASRESKCIEFKQLFDPNSARDSCELIKDIVAIANSGGGIIIFGLDSRGIPTRESIEKIANIDPADISNKIGKYIGPEELNFEIRSLEKMGAALVSFIIYGVDVPLVFLRPGTYDSGGGHQHNAFSSGTVYFRHGAKSEPGNTEDVRKVIDRQLEKIRKSWVKNVRKVVQAPNNAQFITVYSNQSSGTSSLNATPIRVVNDPQATPVRLTRDPSQGAGLFLHEELSDGIFDEINNIIDANRALGKGKKHFYLGQPIYYRIYAERHHVTQNEKDISLLLHAALTDFYAPYLFWITLLPTKLVVKSLVDLYLRPRSPQIYNLTRIASLLGLEFCQWLHKKLDAKWKKNSQAPSFYWSFKKILSKFKGNDPRLLAAKMTLVSQIRLEGETFINAGELLENPQRAAKILSKACMSVFEGENTIRSYARDLDYLTYGGAIMQRGDQLSKAIITLIGDKPAGDPQEDMETES
jgi:hypothetical protein